MGQTDVDRVRANAGSGTLIGILFVVVVLALAGTIGWGVVVGGFDPPTGQVGPQRATPTADETGHTVVAPRP
jgi:hypothetical protein